MYSKIVIELPLDFIKDSMDEIESFVTRNNGEYHVNHHEIFNHDCKDLIKGWQHIGNVHDYTPSSYYPDEPGVYAFVYDTTDNLTSPLAHPNTILFGESTRPAWKRIICHTGALKNTRTNVSDKWQNHLPMINESLGCDIKKDLRNIKIYFRPHDHNDTKWRTERVYSTWMETSCHAIYKVIHDCFPPGNTRDLPTSYTVNKYRKFLTESGYIK